MINVYTSYFLEVKSLNQYIGATDKHSFKPYTYINPVNLSAPLQNSFKLVTARLLVLRFF